MGSKLMTSGAERKNVHMNNSDDDVVMAMTVMMRGDDVNAPYIDIINTHAHIHTRTWTHTHKDTYIFSQSVTCIY